MKITIFDTTMYIKGSEYGEFHIWEHSGKIQISTPDEMLVPINEWLEITAVILLLNDYFKEIPWSEENLKKWFTKIKDSAP